MKKKHSHTIIPLAKNDSRQETLHHVVPRSRGGKDLPFNKIVKRRAEHEAFHALFRNACPREILYILEHAGDLLRALKKTAWNTVFGDVEPVRALRMYLLEWTSKHALLALQNGRGAFDIEWVHTKFSKIFNRTACAM